MFPNKRNLDIDLGSRFGKIYNQTDEEWKLSFDEKISVDVEFFSDLEEQEYADNMKNRHADMVKYGWDKNSFTYKLNSLGFRCGDMLQMQRNDILCLGCSFTFGHGLPEEMIWPTLLEKELGIPTWNLGVAGASSDTVYRLAEQWIPYITPKYVCILMPQIIRREIFGGKELLWGTWSFSTHEHKNIRYYEQSVLNDNNSVMHTHRNLNAIIELCDMAKSKLYIIYADEMLADLGTDKGRDLIHPGLSWQTRITKKFSEKFNK